MKNINRQSLIIYGTNFAGSYIPKIGSLFNPVGAIIFGGINIAKRIYNKSNSPYIRTVETLGGAYYCISAISNVFSSFNGSLYDLGRGILDASMAYHLLLNEEVLNNVKRGQIGKDIKKIKSNLENILK